MADKDDTDYGQIMPGLYKYLSDKQTDDTVEPESDPVTTAAGVALAGPAMAGIKAAVPAITDAGGQLLADEAGTLNMNNLRNMVGKAPTADTIPAAAPEMPTGDLIKSGENTWGPIADSAKPDRIPLANNYADLHKQMSDFYKLEGPKGVNFLRAQSKLNNLK